MEPIRGGTVSGGALAHRARFELARVRSAVRGALGLPSTFGKQDCCLGRWWRFPRRPFDGAGDQPYPQVFAAFLALWLFQILAVLV